MCPVCLTTAALIAGGVTSTGGLAAIALKSFGVKIGRSAGHDADQRRDSDVNEHD